MKMKARYRLFLRRKSVYYAFDDTTRKFASLKTKDKAEANAGHRHGCTLTTRLEGSEDAVSS